MSNEQLGDAPIEPAYHAQMNAIAQALDDVLNPNQAKDDRKVGSVLLCFPFGSHGSRCNFISNGADRRDIVSLFREMISRFEGMPGGSGRG